LALKVSSFSQGIHIILVKLSEVILKPGAIRAFLLSGIIFIFTESAVPAQFLISAPLSDTARVRQVLEYHLNKTAEILRIDFPDTVRVIVAIDERKFKQVLGPAFPDWGAAAAIPERNLIVVKSPDHFPVGKSLDELLGHELGHLMLDNASGRLWLPRWFEEGFCQLISGEWRLAQDFLITRAVWGSGLIPLTALESVNSYGGAKASLAYAQSYLAISALVRDFGIEVLPDFLERYRENNNFYNAFFQATGYDYIEWVGDWQNKTAHRYRLLVYLFDPAVLLPLIALLFVILYLIKIYQVRKKRKRWELEERYRGDDSGFSTPT